PALRHRGALRGDRRAHRVLVPPLPEQPQPPGELDPRAPGGAVGAGDALRRGGRMSVPARGGSTLSAMPAPDAAAPVLRRAPLAELDPRTLYLLAKLRQDVFSLEQKATDPDLDGRDLEPSTTLMWLELPSPSASAADLPGTPVAHLRVLRASDGTVRIGRMAVHAEHRK